MGGHSPDLPGQGTADFMYPSEIHSNIQMRSQFRGNADINFSSHFIQICFWFGGGWGFFFQITSDPEK